MRVICIGGGFDVEGDFLFDGDLAPGCSLEGILGS